MPAFGIQWLGGVPHQPEQQYGGPRLGVGVAGPWSNEELGANHLGCSAQGRDLPQRCRYGVWERVRCGFRLLLFPIDPTSDRV